MSSHDVIFDDEIGDPDNQVARIEIVTGAPTGLLAWLIKKKVAKNGKSAEQILLYFTVGAIILAIGFFFIGVIPHTKVLTPAEAQALQSQLQIMETQINSAHGS